jgi:hypothetical protein
MKTYLVAPTMVLFAGIVSAGELSSDRYLTPSFSTGQTYSNVFSILRSIKADGYDEHASRNGGSADYTVLAANADVWRLRSAWRYDGQQGGENEDELRDGGRTDCALDKNAKDACHAYLEGSGLVYNPTIWGAPPKQLTQGMRWKVDLGQPWELGGANGTEQVTVISVDPRTGTATLMREGTSEGFFSEGDPHTVQLSHGGQTEAFDIKPGTSHWKGYATFVKGVVFSDELVVTRSDVLLGKSGNTVKADERRVMLLNAAPFPTL